MIGNLSVNLQMNTAAFQKGATLAEKRAETLSARMKGIGQSVKGLGAGLAAGFAVAGVSSLASDAFAMASALSEAAAQTGVTVEQLQRLRLAAAQNGSSADAMDKSLSRLSVKLGEAQSGSKSAAEAFTNLGISVEQLKGLNAGDAFALITDKISQIKDPTLQAAYAKQIFGKSAAELLPILKAGTVALDEATAASKRNGEISTEDAAKLDELADSWDMLKTRVGVGVANLIASTARGVEAFDNFFKPINQWAKEFDANFVRMASSAIASVRNMVSNIGIALANLGASLVQVGRDMVAGLVRGIKAAPGAVSDALKSVVSSGVTNVKSYLGIKSPSRLFMQMGGYVSEGFALGITNAKSKVDQAMRGLGTGLDIAGQGIADLANENADNLEFANVRVVKSFADTARDVLSSISGLAQSIKGGGFLGILEGVAGLFLSLGGAGVFGSKLQTNINKPAGRARGGAMTSNRSYLVGEHGPEIMTMGGRPGYMTPNNKMGGGGRASTVQIIPSKYFDVVVDGRAQRQVAAGAPGIATAAAAGVQTNMQQSNFRTLP
jgi:hypothetical protein